MKLKEKLARDAGYRNLELGIGIGLEVDAFIKGFEAARKMANDLLMGMVDEGDPKGHDSMLYKNVTFDICTMGEEEV